MDPVLLRNVGNGVYKFTLFGEISSITITGFTKYGLYLNNCVWNPVDCDITIDFAKIMACVRNHNCRDAPLFANVANQLNYTESFICLVAIKSKLQFNEDIQYTSCNFDEGVEFRLAPVAGDSSVVLPLITYTR